MKVAPCCLKFEKLHHKLAPFSVIDFSSEVFRLWIAACVEIVKEKIRRVNKKDHHWTENIIKCHHTVIP